MKTPSRNKMSTSLTDPVHFAADVLGSVLWRRQRDIMRAVARKPLVAVKACHASGKNLSGRQVRSLVAAPLSRRKGHQHGSRLAAGSVDVGRNSPGRESVAD